MWFYLLFGAAFVGSVIALAFIVARKFPQLTLIDADSLPVERDRKRKKEIIGTRVHRIAQDRWKRAAAAVAPSLIRVRDVFRRQFKKLLTIDRQFRNERLLGGAGKGKDALVAKLLRKAERFAESGKHGEAEKTYIEALSVDERNKDAYLGLGGLCMAQKRYHRARETFAFLAKMTVKEACGQPSSDVKGVPVPRWEAFAGSCPASAAAHAEIAKRFGQFAEACQGDGDMTAARTAIETAVAFEPSNPRYLDLLVEACILEGDQDRANEALERLHAANPENAKVEAFAERIKGLASRSTGTDDRQAAEKAA